ncbi:MAG TPA: hypothetical protein VES40_01030 [Ilumatobacteraceae bacterium]|nr:hypothetical protein [Ilumatobacteraceae bacterium]
MRTTITLEPDVVDLLQRSTREHGLSFKQAVNAAIRQGLAESAPTTRYVVPVRDLGHPTVPLTKALALAAELENDEIIRKMELGK